MPSKIEYEFKKLRGKTEDNKIYIESIAMLSNKYDALLIRIEILEKLLLDLEGKL